MYMYIVICITFWTISINENNSVHVSRRPDLNTIKQCLYIFFSCNANLSVIVIMVFYSSS